MTPVAEPKVPDPRGGWGIALLLLVLVAGVFASRAWIASERAAPEASAAWKMDLHAPSGTVIHAPTRFEVDVFRPDGRPLEGARVAFDLTMPDMEMPLNRFEAPAVPGEPGRYRGEGTFTMKGRWQIEAVARHQGAVSTARRIVQVR